MGVQTSWQLLLYHLNQVRNIHFLSSCARVAWAAASNGASSSDARPRNDLGSARAFAAAREEVLLVEGLWQFQAGYLRAMEA